MTIRSSGTHYYYYYYKPDCFRRIHNKQQCRCMIWVKYRTVILYGVHENQKRSVPTRCTRHDECPVCKYSFLRFTDIGVLCPYSDDGRASRVGRKRSAAYPSDLVRRTTGNPSTPWPLSPRTWYDPNSGSSSKDSNSRIAINTSVKHSINVNNTMVLFFRFLNEIRRNHCWSRPYCDDQHAAQF